MPRAALGALVMIVSWIAGKFIETLLKEEWDSIARWVGSSLKNVGISLAPKGRRREELQTLFDEDPRALVDPVCYGVELVVAGFCMRMQLLRRIFASDTALVLAFAGVTVLKVYYFKCDYESDKVNRWHWLRACVRIRQVLGGDKVRNNKGPK